MKLYTEEQVRSLLNKMDIIYSLEDLTPIELPSDEDIEELMNKNGYYEQDYDDIWREGAKWMKEQIKNQIK